MCPTSSSLSDPGAILLVSCYELGHQPQDLALPAAFLSRAGYEPALLDLAVEPLDVEKLRAARFVGISVPMHTALRLGIRVARRARDINPSAHICFYGLYAPLHAPYLLQGLADSALGGEYEEALVEMVERLGAAVARRSAIDPRRPGVVLRKLDFPVPRREGLPPLERYARLEHGERQALAGYTETSRGCLHSCLHCPIPAVYEGRFFVVPVETVVADVRQQVEMGATHVTFGDADFLNGPGHALRVAQAVHAAFPRLSFDFTAKVEHLLRYRELLPEFASLGALFAVTAVESLSDVVLAHLEKGHTRADVEEALRLLRACGIAMRPAFLPFTPWSTLDDYFDVLDWIEHEDLVDHVDPVQLAIRLLVPPGSLLLQSDAMQPFLGPLDPEALTHAWQHPDLQMDALQRAAARVVEHAASHGEDARTTFRRLRRLAEAARDGTLRCGETSRGGAGSSVDDSPANAPVGSPAGEAPANRSPVPRLTESWFC